MSTVRERSLPVAPMVLAALLTLATCSRISEAVGEPRISAARAPIVLISIDTLRSDRLPAYGYDSVETPAIDALRRDGILCQRAYSHSPLTMPSHASILTGLLPTDHGVRDNIGYRFEPAGVAYLPRLLKDAGRSTCRWTPATGAQILGASAERGGGE